MEGERWSLCGIWWVLLRQNVTGAPVLKHDCIYSQAFKREMLTRLYLSAFQRPETRWKKWMKIFKKIPWDHLPYLIRKSTFCAANKSWVSHEDLYHITHWNSMYNDTLVYAVVRIIIFVCLINLYFMPTTQHLILHSFRGRKNIYSCNNLPSSLNRQSGKKNSLEFLH